jgi:hypothetical protein
MMKLNDRQKDALARIGWTALQVGLPTLAVYMNMLPAAWIPIGTVILAVLKNLVVAHFKE